MENEKITEPKYHHTHPYLYTFILVAASMLLTVIAANFIEVIGSFVVMAFRGTLSKDGINNMGLAATVLSLLGYLIVLLIYWFVFRRELNGFFNARRLLKGILLGSSDLLISVFILIVGILNHKAYGSLGIALLLGIQPGLSEEVLCRIIPISLTMRSKNRKELILPTVIFTSLIFGLGHGVNILSGADPITTLLQVLYATGTGFLFAAIYIRTGNMWITIFLHSLTDTIYYLGLEAQNGNGVLSQKPTVADAIILLIYAVLYFANAFYVFRKNNRVDIPKVWEGIWKGNEAYEKKR